MKDLFNQIGNSLGGLGDKLNGALGGQPHHRDHHQR